MSKRHSSDALFRLLTTLSDQELSRFAVWALTIHNLKQSATELVDYQLWALAYNEALVSGDRCNEDHHELLHWLLVR